jgi:sugar phosphate isomerase/epimerase
MGEAIWAMKWEISANTRFDVEQALLRGEDAFTAVDIAGRRLMYVHASNNDGRADKHRSPDDGVLDWPALRSLFAGQAGDCLQAFLVCRR